MYEDEFDVGPYDNVEFPMRKNVGGGGGAGGTGGTWPRVHVGGAGGASGVNLQGSGVKLYGTTKSGGGGSKLAPLVEVEGAENGDVTRKSGGFNGSSSFSTGATTSVSSNKNTAVNTNSHTTVSNPGFQVNTLPKGTAGFPSVSTGVSVSTGSSVSTGVLSSSSMSAGQQYKSISKGGNSATTGASTTVRIDFIICII